MTGVQTCALPILCIPSKKRNRADGCQFQQAAFSAPEDVLGIGILLDQFRPGSSRKRNVPSGTGFYKFKFQPRSHTSTGMVQEHFMVKEEGPATKRVGGAGEPRETKSPPEEGMR